MGWTFLLEPQTAGGSVGEYDERARAAMEAYLKCLPNAFQRSDGCLLLAESAEDRDWIVSGGLVDESHIALEHILIQSDRVVMEAWPNGNGVQLLADFIEWSMAQWPATLRDADGGQGIITLEQFLDWMDSNRRYR